MNASVTMEMDVAMATAALFKTGIKCWQGVTEQITVMGHKEVPCVSASRSG